MMLASCTLNYLTVKGRHSVNYDQRIQFLVMHYSAEDYNTSVNNLVSKGASSSHYLIPNSYDKTYVNDELKVQQLVSENNSAWHTGNSYWQGQQAINSQSIGVTLVNVADCKQAIAKNTRLATAQESGFGRMCFYSDYDPDQITLLIKLAKEILKNNPDISPVNIVGHSDINPLHQNDPGPRFPWYLLYQEGIGAWYEKATVLKYSQLFAQQMPNIGLIQRALKIYGYDINETGELDKQTQAVLYAFQSHFLPWKITGLLDVQTASSVFALIDKYIPKNSDGLLARYQKELNVVISKDELIAKNGQIDQFFPQKNRSTRALVNDRAIFRSYKGRGNIIIDNQDAKAADIFVNGEKLNIAKPLQKLSTYKYSLKRRTRNGNNTFRVENVVPAGSNIKITIPFPYLLDESNSNIHDFTIVDEQIQNDVKQGFPGAVLVVVKNGKIVKNSAYGYARKYADGGDMLDAPVKMDTDTLFDIASNTKMFATNFALMKLVSEDKINVNKPISHYLPMYRGEGRELRTITDLLTHNAGYSPEIKFFTKNNKLGDDFFSQDAKRTKDLILTKVPFAVGRGTKRIYSDTDYMLLGMIVEEITGLSLDMYVEYNFYHPLGLSKTLFNPLKKGFSKYQFAASEIHGTTRGKRVDYDNIRTYVLQGEVHDEKAYHSFDGVAGHAGLFSTGKELAVMAQVLLNRGGYGKNTLFSANVIDQFIKPDDGNGTYGLGWRRANNGERKWHFGPYASSSAYGHTGWTGTVTVIDPEHDLAIILLTNARHSEIEGDKKNFQFKGKQFETGKYGSIISLVYEAILEN